ncbi:MAG: hypothetical protein MK180_06880 [Rhodobacteraceae bacterium]|nr:hypothetical protein [Paracoccaceae bacterium]
MVEANDTEKSAQTVMRLERISRYGQVMGLRPGDLLLTIDGRRAGAKASRGRGETVAGNTRALLGLARGKAVWFVFSNVASLGAWAMVEHADPAPALPQAPTLARNWEVWCTDAGTYDLCRATPGLEDALVPYVLIKMRLWEACALWSTLLVVSVMLGGVLGIGLQVISWVYFWRMAPDLVRREWLLQGMHVSHVLAARSEQAAHRAVGTIAPDLTSRYGPVSTPAAT